MHSHHHREETQRKQEDFRVQSDNTREPTSHLQFPRLKKLWMNKESRLNLCSYYFSKELFLHTHLLVFFTFPNSLCCEINVLDQFELFFNEFFVT